MVTLRAYSTRVFFLNYLHSKSVCIYLNIRCLPIETSGQRADCLISPQAFLWIPYEGKNLYEDLPIQPTDGQKVSPSMCVGV